MIVIDIGCARYGAELSIEKLIQRYAPDVLYGFDPSPRIEEGWQTILGAKVLLKRSAAWICDGEIGFAEAGLRSRVSEGIVEPLVRCFDLARFIVGLPENEIVLKLDCEGAEIPLLEHLNEAGADTRLALCLVEWHCESCGTGGDQHTADCPLPSVPKIGGLRCPIEDWVL